MISVILSQRILLLHVVRLDKCWMNTVFENLVYSYSFASDSIILRQKIMNNPERTPQVLKLGSVWSLQGDDDTIVHCQKFDLMNHVLSSSYSDTNRVEILPTDYWIIQYMYCITFKTREECSFPADVLHSCKDSCCHSKLNCQVFYTFY